MSNATREAEALGATVTAGICWTWAKGFPSQEIAEDFTTFLVWEGYGICKAFELRGVWCVRFR